MTLRRRGRPLSLRVWLILAVVAVVVAATGAEIALSQAMVSWQRHADAARLDGVRGIIGADATRWRDPSWQRHAEVTLAALDVEAALFGGGANGPVFVTAGARRFLDTDLSAGARGTNMVVDSSASETTPTFQRIVIQDPARHSAPTRPPRGIALLLFTGPAPGSPSPWLWPLAAGAAILLVLVGAVGLLGRLVLRPLAAMSRAAQGIAGGDLEVRLPSSPAREVAEVAAALEGMSAALRESLTRQKGLEEERRLFIGAIAHDLRTPLFMLRGYLQGLENGVAATPERMAHYVAACRAKADALERLIADLFAYTRLEHLEQQPACAPLDLGVLLGESVEGIQGPAAAKGIGLALDGPAEPCMLSADGHLLARAIDNLLENALRHTPDGGRIRVSWKREDTAVRVAVEDSGSGIAAHDLPHVFTPLYRGEASRNRQTGGAGLGLAIARRILTVHSGDLTAANSPTGGAVFTATLPVPPAARHAAIPPEPVAAARS